MDSWRSLTELGQGPGMIVKVAVVEVAVTRVRTAMEITKIKIAQHKMKTLALALLAGTPHL